ncbi:PAN domain-containing protein At5g03700 [Fagus crenata]
MYGLMISLTRLRPTQLLLLTISILDTCNIAEATTKSLFQGFKATPNPSVSSFQPFLNDSTGNFSLGFLRVDKTQLALAVVHVPSSQPLWLANPTQLATRSDRTQLFFNGSLVISNSHARVFWPTQTNDDIVVLLNSSNLQIQNLHNSPSILWQSFDFPSDTLVENQNFTINMSLISSNGLYSMRLGYNFIGLDAKFQENSAQPDQIYLKHTALEAEAQIVEGQRPISSLVNSDGYLGLLQNGTKLIDVQAFNSFQRPINGFLRVRLEPNGNLIAYYWDGSSWVLDFKAISDTCELSSPCGSYGLCTPGQQSCSCLVQIKDNYWAFTRKGVEVPFKELMYYETTSLFGECEGMCENNCSCWGAMYNNGFGFCFLMDYPIQTLMSVGDESKVGYFKVREGGEKKKTSVVAAIGYLAAGGAIMILIGIGGFWTYRIWRRKTRYENDEVSPSPYKNLETESSKSMEVEMCNRL